MTKWKDLYKYLNSEQACNPIEENKELKWTCFSNLKFTKQFCKENNIDFNRVKVICESFGGFCDCELLFNVTEVIKGMAEMPVELEKERVNKNESNRLHRTNK